ncbi:MAG: DUF4230 domain-containing protein [Anaerolineae bacterium]|nr:DUF4230 domain-containing protein [Thermoflexales bacterium]MDW8395626.1 DUF4230 domain-containing protein [Anaerolineae bacterium]
MSELPGNAPPALPEPLPPPPPPARQPSPIVLGCAIGSGILALGTIISAVLIFSAVREVIGFVERNNPIRAVGTLLPNATPTLMPRPPALLQVRAVSELATAQTLMSTVVEAEKARVGNVIYERLVLIACGRVKAGVDLSQLGEADVRVSTDGVTVQVRLPRARLLDAYLIDDANHPCATRVYDRTNLLLLPETKELETQARDKALQAIRQAAVESGLLDDAQRNAEIAVERVLLLSGYQRVEFIRE